MQKDQSYFYHKNIITPLWNIKELLRDTTLRTIFQKMGLFDNCRYHKTSNHDWSALIKQMFNNVFMVKVRLTLLRSILKIP